MLGEITLREQSDKTIFVVLGMHRSATSLTTELLSEMGGYLGTEQEVMPAGRDNPKGFFERNDVAKLDDNVLLKNDMAWLSFRKNKLIKYNEEDKKEAQFIVDKLCEESFDNYIVIKDPRMCLTEELWHESFIRARTKEKIVVVFRHPDEVANSLSKRDGMDYGYACALWFYYNLNILNRLLCLKNENIPILYINHNKYFDNAKENILKLLNFVGEKNDWKAYEHIIETGLYHNHAECKMGDELYVKIMSLYRYLMQLECGEVILRREDVERYNYAWEDIYNIFCMEDDKKKTLAFELRNIKLCCYEMEQKKELLTDKFDKFFDEKGIDEIFIYGNGMVASVLYPILAGTRIRVNKIFDKKANHEEVLIGDRSVSVEQYVPGCISEGDIILNTVIRRPQEIEILFPEKLSEGKYYLISDLLYFFESGWRICK